MTKERPCKEAESLLEKEKEKNKCERSKRNNLTNGRATTSITPRPSTSISPRPATSTDTRHPKVSAVISLSDSENSDNDGSSPWTNSKNIVRQKAKCPYCGIMYEARHHLIKHITTTCLSNPDSKTNKEAGKFRCSECGRNYGQAKALRYHQKHECQQVVTCPDCHKTMRGTYITERHKQNHCVNKQRNKKIKQEDTPDSPDELFIDDSSIEF